MKYTFRDETDANIRICWAINNAVAENNAEPVGSRGSDQYPDYIKNRAIHFLELFEEIKSEVRGVQGKAESESAPMCVNCKGVQLYGGTGLNKDGLCANCANTLSFQARDAKADNQKNRDARKGQKVGKPITN